MPDTLPEPAPVPVRWSAACAAQPPQWQRPGAPRAMLRGFLGRCPSCGQAPLFTGWLRQIAVCPHCAAPLGAVRADDAPPYFVIFIVAHLVIATQLALESVAQLPLWDEAAIFLPLTLAASLALLRPVKGATIGLMLQFGMVSQPDA